MIAVNDAFRARRLAMGLSQDEFAKRLQAAGARTANKRLVQRYEYGEIRSPYPRQARALEEVTGLPVAALGFEPAAVGAKVVDDGRGGHDLHHPVPELAADCPQANGAAAGSYTGVWLSRYEYFSSGRGDSFVGLHYVVVLQSGNRLTVRSLAGSSASSLTMDMTVDGPVLTGTWVEQTDPEGYYRAARYHGAIQMLAEPTGRRLRGKWLGFGKQMEINSGPWELTFQHPSTHRATLARYNARPPESVAGMSPS